MRIGNLSFGSTYAVKYDYRRVLPGEYETTDFDVKQFIEVYNNYSKSKDDISAINPKTKTYYIKTSDSKDKLIENDINTFELKSKVKKVDDDKMVGAVITSIGKNGFELVNISKTINSYEEKK